MISAQEMQAVIAASVEYEANTGCWLWMRGLTGDGYGSLGFEGWPRGAHRASYQAHGGDLSAGNVVRHRCDVPLCVNPAHLVIGSYSDNVRDSIERGRHRTGDGTPPVARRTHCQRGHPFTPENTYTYRGDRGCLECRRNRDRRSKGREESVPPMPATQWVLVPSELTAAMRWRMGVCLPAFGPRALDAAWRAAIAEFLPAPAKTDEADD